MARQEQLLTNYLQVMPQYDITHRFSDVFGFVSRNVTPRIAAIGLGGSLLPYGVLEQFKVLRNNDQADRFDIVELHYNSSTDGNESQQKYIFPLAPLVQLSRKKLIKETVINNGEGEVVEDFGLSSWHFTIRGLLIGDDHQYPSAHRKTLSDVFEIRDTFEIVSTYLNSLGITDGYMKNITFRDSLKYPDTVGYTITGKSHTSVNLIITD